MDKKIDTKIIGKKLKDLRGDKSQSEVANAIGVTTMAISSYENGERVPRDEIKIKLAEYFETNVEYLFFSYEVSEMCTK